MTPEDHNKTLGICHVAYGAFHTLLVAAMFAFFFVMMMSIPGRPGDEPPMAFFGLIFGFIFAFSALFTIPSFVAGYGLLKRRSWAKTASIVAAVFESMQFPFGTALCVYSLWFAFGDAGKGLYDNNYNPTAHRLAELNRAGNEQSAWYKQGTAEREPVYSRPTQPPQPPDWRE